MNRTTQAGTTEQLFKEIALELGFRKSFVGYEEDGTRVYFETIFELAQFSMTRGQ